MSPPSTYVQPFVALLDHATLAVTDADARESLSGVWAAAHFIDRKYAIEMLHNRANEAGIWRSCGKTPPDHLAAAGPAIDLVQIINTATKRRPCKACPWRVSATPADIPNYQPELSARLAVNCRDDGRSVMACHESKEGQRVLCAGYALSVGIKAIGVRMLVSAGTVDLDDYHADEPLHPDFEAMHRAQGVVTPPRNRVEGL